MAKVYNTLAELVRDNLYTISKVAGNIYCCSLEAAELPQMQVRYIIPEKERVLDAYFQAIGPIDFSVLSPALEFNKVPGCSNNISIGHVRHVTWGETLGEVEVFLNATKAHNDLEHTSSN